MYHVCTSTKESQNDAPSDDRRTIIDEEGKLMSSHDDEWSVKIVAVYMSL